MQIGRLIYYDKEAGNVLCDTGEREGDVVVTTEAEDFSSFPQLHGIDQATVNVLQLAFGDYSTEYQTGYISNVNPSTQAVTFTSYPP